MFYIGIDVGFAGSICILNDDSKLEYFCKMPLKDATGAMKHDYDEVTIIDLLNKYYPNTIVLEYQHTRPGQGAVTQSRQMYGYGLLKGIISVISRNNFYIIDPLKWQNYFNKKYLSIDQLTVFKNKKISLDNSIDDFEKVILDKIKDENFKNWYAKWSNNKTTSPSKCRSTFIYYLINENNINDIKYKDNNIVDSFLLAKYCYDLKNKK